MFRLYSLFLAPVFLPEWVEDEGGGAFTCYAFIAKVLGALKKVRGWGGRGRMHGRVSAVAVWTELYCPGNLSVASQGPCSYPSPHPIQSFSLIHKKTPHMNTHTCLYCLSILCAYLMFHTTFSLFLSHCLFHCPSSVLSHLVSLSCTLLCLYFPLTSRYGLSLLLLTPSCSLLRLIDVIVMLHRQ